MEKPSKAVKSRQNSDPTSISMFGHVGLQLKQLLESGTGSLCTLNAGSFKTK